MSDALVDLLYSAVRFTAITTTKGVPDPQWRFAYRFFGSRGIRSTNNRKEPAVTDFAWVAQCREMIWVGCSQGARRNSASARHEHCGDSRTTHRGMLCAFVRWHSVHRVRSSERDPSGSTKKEADY